MVLSLLFIKFFFSISISHMASAKSAGSSNLSVSYSK
jgi:hypothetical protein